ncbi:transcription factor ORG2-like [Pyrus ussuriensis x Pyrus communis]|uniref:Transcription factor ORG2-like n=1 Tax=Pyrus ussuriensis x Pyrus communis TaxID=2448454 RepID=A0A5N5FZ20_9ROSA|nr:transcription factor ORG2-like [Pyrus ussuriensis x Pyrus communis]
MFSTIGWPIDQDLTSHDYYKDHITTTNDQTAESSSLHILPSGHPKSELDRSTPSTTISGEYSSVSPVAKKLNHNASERDRRKKINSLYSSLRSLLPADQLKKLSIPNTVSRVVKYIPELQKQVEGLIRKREELLSRITKQESALHEEKNQIKSAARSSLSAVSAYQLNDKEVAIQISSLKTKNNLLSDILLNLEDEEGLQILNASSFESSGGRVFYNLQFQMERTYRLECESLSDKLMSFSGQEY